MSPSSGIEHPHAWESIGEHEERCECGKRRLKPMPDLYNGRYSRSLKGRWWSRWGGFVLVVEGRGNRRGTVAAHAEHDPINRQDDMPITTLRTNYEGLR